MYSFTIALCGSTSEASLAAPPAVPRLSLLPSSSVRLPNSFPIELNMMYLSFLLYSVVCCPVRGVGLVFLAGRLEGVCVCCNENEEW